MWQRNDASGPMARPHVTASLFDKFLVLAALTFTLRLRLGGESIKPSDFFFYHHHLPTTNIFFHHDKYII
jgi:hypothetical protein